jgi:hypothetical protein
MTNDELFPELTSEAAKAMSALGASKGGKARANTLTKEERQEIARAAVNARWAKAGKLKAVEEPPKEKQPVQTVADIPYSMFKGTLDIGDTQMECHVLSDGRRVFTQREIVRILTGGRESGHLGRYLENNPLIDKDLTLGQTFEFRVEGATAIGREATTLIEICEKYLQAQEQKKLKKNQLKLAVKAGIIIRSCAKVGIIALIDEATGFQQFREKRALQLKLQAFIADELQEWARVFPPDFWYELARLEGIRYSPRNRPLRWGKYIMAFVYDSIDKDVGKQLREKNPNPRFKKNHHQWLKEYGKDKLIGQIQSVITIMKLCTDMEDFRTKFAKVFKKTPLQTSFEDINWNFDGNSTSED